MAIYRVQAPDGSILRIEGPDDAAPEQIEAFARANYGQQSRKAEKYQPVSPMEGVGTGQRLLEGAGQGASDIWMGMKQRLGMASEDEVAEKRRIDAPLLETGAGRAGSIAGQLAAAVPSLAIPGANTVAGAAGVGALTGALQPTVRGESVTQNALLGGLMGGGAQHAIGKVAGAAGQSLGRAEMAASDAAKMNAPRDAILQKAREMGYAAPPSSIEGSGMAARVMEGLSGKEKISQLASVRNQNVTERAARRELGIGDNDPITPQSLKAVRNEAYETGYKPITDLAAVNWDKKFITQLKRLSPSSAGGAVKNPAATEIDDLVSALANKNSWTGEQLVRDIRALREQSRALYSSAKREGGNVAKSDLAKAQGQAAELLEGLAERNMGPSGVQAIADLRKARALIAKTHSVEDALARAGHVDASVLARAFARGEPLSGELKAIAQFAKHAPESTQVPKSGWSNPVTAVDFGVGMLGSPAFGLARVGQRYGLLSDIAQDAIMNPKYGPNLARKLSAQELKRLRDLGAGGLLGVYAE